jgi:DNA modification methylase
MTVRIINADVMDGLALLDDESVHCVVTSPPYFGLRDYGHTKQIGLEPTPDAYVTKMVGVFRDVRRVLRKDGTCWLNLGDSYVATTTMGDPAKRSTLMGGKQSQNAARARPDKTGFGLAAKNLIGIPWRVAFALQADGWWLRQDIIWSKPNPMPESVTDRCTKAHEYIFLLTKAARYLYDAEAIKEPANYPDGPGNTCMGKYGTDHAAFHGSKKNLAKIGPSEHRNKRSVWEVNTGGYSEAHFATFPPALIEPCIKAGCPEGGTVLDPFGGSGTTGLVADRLKRNAILIELNPEYAAMAERRVMGDCPMFAEVSANG